MTSVAREAGVVAESFPVLSSGVSLHVTPSIGIVKAAKRMVPLSAGRYASNSEGMQFINKEATQILHSSDGTSTVGQIVREAYGEQFFQEVIAPISAFFEDCAARGFVDLCSAPRPRDLRVTGSFDYYVPVHIAVELTALCNLRCTHCYNEFLDPTPGLDAEELITILQEWKEYGLQGVELTGGEPLLYRGFWDVFEFCVRSFHTVGVLTNGTLVTREVADRLGEYKDQLVMSISLDGSCADIHEKIRGKGTFRKTTAAIRYLSERGIMVRAGMSVTPESIYDLEATLLLAKELGAERFSWSPIAPFGRGEGQAWDWDPEKSMAVHEIEKGVMEKYEGFVTVIPRQMMPLMDQLGNCGAGHKNLVLSPSGKLRPCLFQPETEHIGDLRKESLEDIFRKPTLGFLANLKGPSEDLCGECRYWAYCKACSVRPLRAIEREGRLCVWAETRRLSSWLEQYKHYTFDPEEPVFR